MEQIIQMFFESKVKNGIEQNITHLDITGVFTAERPKCIVLLATSRFEEFLDSVHPDIINFYKETYIKVKF